MTKEDLIGMFRTAYNNCKLVYASITLFGYEDMASYYEQLSRSLDIPEPYDKDDLLALLHNRDVLKLACNELYDSVHRSALAELFEMTKVYCKESDQLALLQEQPWYQFWRIIRNSFSHDFVFHFGEHDKRKLPITWSGVTLDSSLEGQSLTQTLMSREQLLAFLDDVKAFIEKGLV